VDFKIGDTVIYPQHGACIVEGRQSKTAFGVTRDYLILRAIIGEMTLSVPLEMAEEVGVRPPVSADELEDLVAVLSKPDPRVPSNWSRRFKNHQEKLKSGDVYQVAEVVRNLAARNRDAALSAAERTMYERARTNLISEISPALGVTAEEAEDYLDRALEKGVLRAPVAAAKKK
jgi:CarD family transcriptional regulator